MKLLSRDVHGLELAAVDRNARFREEPHLAAEFDKSRTYPVMAPRHCLCGSPRWSCDPVRAVPQPHDFDIASSFSFEPPARLDPVEIAVDVKLEDRRRMVPGPTGRRRIDAIKPEVAEVQCIDEHIDRTYRIALVHAVIEVFGQ